MIFNGASSWKCQKLLRSYPEWLLMIIRLQASFSGWRHYAAIHDRVITWARCGRGKWVTLISSYGGDWWGSCRASVTWPNRVNSVGHHAVPGEGCKAQPPATANQVMRPSLPDEMNLLTEDSHGVFYDAEVNQPFVVPCKPTFPEVKVTLEKNQGAFVSSSLPFVVRIIVVLAVVITSITILTLLLLLSILSMLLLIILLLLCYCCYYHKHCYYHFYYDCYYFHQW